MPDPLEELRATIRSAAGAMRDAAPDAITPTLERPPKPELGDYSTNAAMLLAPALGQAPHEVEREYLLNDVGGQVRRFAESIAARMQGREPPEDGYRGEYVMELAGDLAAAGADPADLEELARSGTEAMRERIEATLERFGVRFDTWFSERSLHEGSKIQAAIEHLRRR